MTKILLFLVVSAAAIGLLFIPRTIVVAPDPASPVVIQQENKIIIPEILSRIAFCESGNKHFTDDGSVIRGKINPLDIGRYQINLYYHESTAQEMGFDLFDEQDNETYALWLFENQGTKPWSWSQSCWSK